VLELLKIFSITESSSLIVSDFREVKYENPENGTKLGSSLPLHETILSPI